MNRKLFCFAAALISLVSCDKRPNVIRDGDGLLSFSRFEIKYNDDTDIDVSKATMQAPGTYVIRCINEDGVCAWSGTYASVLASGKPVSLPAGKYTLEVSSTDSPVEPAAFGNPVYGAGTELTIVTGQTTELQPIICRLVQCKVTVDYAEDFLAEVTGDGVASVEVTAGKPLKYALQYNNGKPVYEKSEGYFTLNNGDKTTMIVSFSGKINGEEQSMTTPPITGIRPAQWRKITIVKKVNDEGNTGIAVKINGFIEDNELSETLEVPLEPVIGDDPEAPADDGGIKLEFAPGCTMFSDLGRIIVPEMTSTMDLRLIATVPGGISKFTVEISSTSKKFIDAVNLAGGTTLDLINPSEDADAVFMIVPFPHGKDLIGMTEVGFDLGAAQEPILHFKGEHTFTMKVVDGKGCRRELPVTMIVEKEWDEQAH